MDNTEPGQDPNGALVGAVLFCGLGLIGTLIGAWGINGVLEDADWVRINATVVDVQSEPFTFEGKRSGGGSYEATGQRIKVVYAYEVNGTRYQSDRYSRLDPHDDYTEPEKAKPRLTALERGTVTAWFDPAAPSEAVLAKAERAPPLFVGSAGLILLTIGVWRSLVWRNRKRLRAQLAALDEESP